MQFKLLLIANDTERLYGRHKELSLKKESLNIWSKEESNKWNFWDCTVQFLAREMWHLDSWRKQSSWALKEQKDIKQQGWVRPTFSPGVIIKTNKMCSRYAQEKCQLYLCSSITPTFLWHSMMSPILDQTAWVQILTPPSGTVYGLGQVTRPFHASIFTTIKLG